MTSNKKGRITGIGGVFFKCKDPKSLKDWYASNFGLLTDDYGALFEFRQGADPEKPGYLQWSPMPEDTDYFAPSGKAFMINYRVENLDSLLDELRAEGVTILDEVAEYEYGRFVHILDPEGNNIELWEPVDQVFTKNYNDRANK